MPTLAPRTEFQVAIENPVNKPSSLKAIAGLVDTGLKAAGDMLDKDPNLEQGLIDGLDAANQLREQGDAQGALAMERNVMTNYGIAGGKFNETTNNIIRTYTGRDAAVVGFTQDELLMQEIQDPDSELGRAYNRSLLAAKGMNPDADDTAQHELAMSLIVKEQANEMLIEEAKFQWSQASKGAILDKVANFGSVSLGALHGVAAEGGTVSLDDIQAVRSSFNLLKTQIMAGRPSHVPAEEWKTITDALAAREDQIKYLEELAGPGNLDARATADLITGLQEAGISDFNANIMTRLVVDNPGIFLERGAITGAVFGQDLSTVAKYMDEKGDGLSDGDVRTANTWDDTAMFGEDGKPLATSEGLKYAQASTTVMGMIDNDTLSSNSAARNEWARASVRQLSAIQGISEQGGYISSNDLTKMFGPKWISDMNTLQMVDPALYNATLAKTNRVLGAQLNIIGRKFDSVAQGSPFEFNKSSGDFRFNPETARRVIGDKMADALEAGVRKHYGGDYDALMADNGGAFYDEGEKAASSAWARVSGVRSAVPEDIRQMGSAYATVNSTLGRLNEFNPQQSNQSSFQDESPIMKMMDQTEGGGAYNTLFGHAQRKDTPFNGVDITGMTIGELKAFTDPSGKYGQWVKGKVGRVATPMGRYQFVGTTMKAVADKMGLGDDVLFTPAVQDAMFHFHVNDILEGKPQSEWAGILKGTWEGFKGKSDEEVTAAAAEFLGTPPPAVAFETGRGDFASTLAPDATEAPEGRPLDLDTSGSEVQSTGVAELDDAATSTEVEEGDASKKANADSKAQVIAELMEKWGLNERDATRLYEKARDGV